MSQLIANLSATLERTQWMTPGEFAAHRDTLLRRMLEHAIAQCPHYAKTLQPLVRRNGKLDLEGWSNLTFLTREDAQADPDAITAKQVPEYSGTILESSTSGSTARAFRQKRSQLVSALASALTERGQKWFGTDFSGTMAVITAHEDEAANSPGGDVRPGGWQAGGKAGTLARLGLKAGTLVQDRWLEQLKPDYLSIFPSILTSLCEMEVERGWPAGVRLAFCAGETLSEEQRSRIAESTGIRTVNCYGTTETGLLAFECPHSGLMHVMAESALLEVVDGDGRPAGPGEEGELVVTSFVNFAMPFIRYRIGDIAKLPGKPCSCGRALPSLERVLGRTRNMFKRPDGSYIWPNVLSRIFGQFVPHRQFRFTQKSPSLVELQYVPVSADQVEDRDAMLAYARERLFTELELEYRRVETVPRSTGGKFEDYIREIP